MSLAEAFHAPVVETTKKIPLMRPLLPSADKLLPYLKQIDSNRWYSNSGPLEETFRQRLGDMFGLMPASVVPVSSGTTALQIALRAKAREGRKKCLVPSWTFIATPLAAVQAGLEPHFVDIDPATWALSPAKIVARADLDEVAAIVVVAPFGQPPDISAWNRVTDETGIPVIIDAAAAFDSVGRKSLASTSKAPLIVSLHATKSFGIGEGGLILTNDPEFAARCDRLRNFGFDGSPISVEAGTNGKLSEYHAAVGLAALDGWTRKRQRLTKAQARYRSKIEDLDGVSLMPGISGDWVAGTLNIMVSESVDSIIQKLAAKGIEARQWWARGCHRHPAFETAAGDALPVTERLANQVLGVPFSADMSVSDIDLVCRSL